MANSAAAGSAHLIISATNPTLASFDSGLSVSPAAAALAGSQTFYITCFSLQNLNSEPSVLLSDANSGIFNAVRSSLSD